MSSTRRDILKSATLAAGLRASVRAGVPAPLETDVLVAGGGPAGIGAAMGAALAGARTLLIENHAFLGGVGAWPIAGGAAASSARAAAPAPARKRTPFITVIPPCPLGEPRLFSPGERLARG